MLDFLVGELGEMRRLVGLLMRVDGGTPGCQDVVKCFLDKPQTFS